jgi:nucleotide-binding universal stress UspA family protein
LSQQILVPLDGSTHAAHALPWAIGISAKSGATIHLVLVHEPDEYSEYAGAHFEDYDQEGKAHETDYLDGVRKKLVGDFAGTVELHHLEGVVQETLTAEAERLGIDLVVMNAHGWGYTSRALLGSVSDYLMRHLHVPLLLLHSHASHGALHRPVLFRRVLVPLDGSELAASIVPRAEALGKLWNAEYHLVRVVAPATPFGGLLGTTSGAGGAALFEKSRDDARRYLESIAARMRDRALTASTQVLVHRKSAAAILQEANTAECDLIAMSTHGRGGLSRLVMGSVADKVVRAADAPVLVYQPAES